MSALEALRSAFRALGANRVRSALTTIGVSVGVAAVILLVSIGSGVKKQVAGQIEGLGSNLLFVFPQSAESIQQGGGDPYSIRKKLTLDDSNNVQTRLGDSAIVVPVIIGSGEMRFGNRRYNATIAAGTERGKDVFTAVLAAGRHYTRGEWEAASRVVALGWDVRNQLFPNSDPVGQTVVINGERFTVIGYYQQMGGGVAGSDDQQVYMPSTAAARLLGSSDLSELVIKAADANDIARVKRVTETALRPKFGNDFSVFTQAETLGVFNTVLGTLTAMLAGLASISLVVGGIGIMNIMLVSVSERTREIGIRKAVGARTWDVLAQFLAEAVVLSVTGGLVGVLVGWLGGIALQRWVPAEVTAGTVLLAFVCSAAVGVFFGVYPAWRAAQLDPIVALRYE